MKKIVGAFALAALLASTITFQAVATVGPAGVALPVPAATPGDVTPVVDPAGGKDGPRPSQVVGFNCPPVC